MNQTTTPAAAQNPVRYGVRMTGADGRVVTVYSHPLTGRPLSRRTASVVQITAIRSGAADVALVVV